MGARKLSDKQKIALELARAYIKGHGQMFRIMMGWLRANGQKALHEGYVATALGRKRWFRTPTIPREVRAEYELEMGRHQAPSGDNTLRLTELQYAISKCPNYLNDRDPDGKLTHSEWLAKQPAEWRMFMEQCGAIEREGGNTPIQGGNADITKIAMVGIRNRLRQRGYYPQARISLQVYDEIVCRCPEAIAEEVCQIVDEEMIRAGQMVITRVPVIVEGGIARTWTK